MPFFLAISRAIGETMIVVMVQVWLKSNCKSTAVTTVTVQIVTLWSETKNLIALNPSAFALGLMLFVITLALNVFAMIIVRRYRERYE